MNDQQIPLKNSLGKAHFWAYFLSFLFKHCIDNLLRGCLLHAPKNRRRTAFFLENFFLRDRLMNDQQTPLKNSLGKAHFWAYFLSFLFKHCIDNPLRGCLLHAPKNRRRTAFFLENFFLRDRLMNDQQTPLKNSLGKAHFWAYFLSFLFKHCIDNPLRGCLLHAPKNRRRTAFFLENFFLRDRLMNDQQTPLKNSLGKAHFWAYFLSFLFKHCIDNPLRGCLLHAPKNRRRTAFFLENFFSGIC